MPLHLIFGKLRTFINGKNGYLSMRILSAVARILNARFAKASAGEVYFKDWE